MVEFVSTKIAIFIGVISYLLVSWGIPYLDDRGGFSDDELMSISLADYSMLMEDYKTAELPFQRHIRPYQVFSDTYQNARAAFLQAAEELKEHWEYKCRVTQVQKGDPKPISIHNLKVWEDDQQTYTTDIVVLPGNKPGLLIHSSGVHGVEGYAGSAIQVAFLHLIRQFYEDGQLLHHPTVILVHAVNPVGMARYRRVNENNVDLNLNGLLPEEWSNPGSDKYERYFGRDKYDQLSASLLNPATAPTRWDATFGFFVNAVAIVMNNGLFELTGAVKRGQYHDPTGINYGGKDQTTEPSLTLLKDWLADFIHEQAQKDDNPDKSAIGAITWIDLHTGGATGAGSDTLVMSTISCSNDETKKHVQKHFTADALAYQSAKGSLADYCQPLFQEQQHKALILRQEFATVPVPVILIGRALILENAAYQHLPADEALDWAKRTMKPAFYPQSKDWRRKVLERGVRTLVQAMKRSMLLSKKQE